MSRYHRENPEEPIQHEWFAAGVHKATCAIPDATQAPADTPKTELPCGYCKSPSFKGVCDGKCPYCGKTYRRKIQYLHAKTL